MKKQTLCLIFGGNSREYFVSLRSCACILKHIDREKYRILKIGITRDGKWYFYMGDENKIEEDTWEKYEKYPVYASLTTGELTYFNKETVRVRPDIVFPIIHGDYGEDGRLRGVFDAMGLKCVGCSAESGAITVNKYLTKLICKDIGVPVADFFLLRKRDLSHKESIFKKGRTLGYPLFIKAVCLGSSIGIYRVKNEDELLSKIETALGYSDSVLMEKEIKGTETEIAILSVNGEIRLG